MRETYDARRRLLMGALDEMGFTYGEPRGGLYISAHTARLESPRSSSPPSFSRKAS